MIHDYNCKICNKLIKIEQDNASMIVHKCKEFIIAMYIDFSYPKKITINTNVPTTFDVYSKKIECKLSWNKKIEFDYTPPDDILENLDEVITEMKSANENMIFA